jgi:transcriptional regulator with XRE-family HTH domain
MSDLTGKRLARGWLLADVSDRTGLTVGQVNQAERKSRAGGAIAAHQRILEDLYLEVNRSIPLIFDDGKFGAVVGSPFSQVHLRCQVATLPVNHGTPELEFRNLFVHEVHAAQRRWSERAYQEATQESAS